MIIFAQKTCPLIVPVERVRLRSIGIKTRTRPTIASGSSSERVILDFRHLDVPSAKL